jgi:hypothetical protein
MRPGIQRLAQVRPCSIRYPTTRAVLTQYAVDTYAHVRHIKAHAVSLVVKEVHGMDRIQHSQRTCRALL